MHFFAKNLRPNFSLSPRSIRRNRSGGAKTTFARSLSILLTPGEKYNHHHQHHHPHRYGLFRVVENQGQRSSPCMYAERSNVTTTTTTSVGSRNLSSHAAARNHKCQKGGGWEFSTYVHYGTRRLLSVFLLILVILRSFFFLCIFFALPVVLELFLWYNNFRFLQIFFAGASLVYTQQNYVVNFVLFILFHRQGIDMHRHRRHTRRIAFPITIHSVASVWGVDTMRGDLCCTTPPPSRSHSNPCQAGGNQAGGLSLASKAYLSSLCSDFSSCTLSSIAL